MTSNRREGSVTDGGGVLVDGGWFNFERLPVGCTKISICEFQKTFSRPSGKLQSCIMFLIIPRSVLLHYTPANHEMIRQMFV